MADHDSTFTFSPVSITVTHTSGENRWASSFFMVHLHTAIRRRLAGVVTLSRQGTADVPFDGAQLTVFLRGCKARRVPIGFGASRPSNPVHVVLGRLWQIEIDHALNPGHVDPARGDIRRNQNAIAAVPKSFQRLASL
jgi:hypothetical protein